MLRERTDRARPGLVAFYDFRPGNGAGLFFQPKSPHGAGKGKTRPEFCTGDSLLSRFRDALYKSTTTTTTINVKNLSV